VAACGLDDRSRALISVAIAATLGTRAGAARAFDSYQVALAVFAENSQ